MKSKINRLAKAATISDIRMTMNIEDEMSVELMVYAPTNANNI